MDNFHEPELRKALSEQHYGIINYHIDHTACTSNTAVAFVDLLEQRQIRVGLSNHGYEVLETDCSTMAGPQNFETVENLLTTVSPMYRKRHAEEIIARLSQLSESSS